MGHSVGAYGSLYGAYVEEAQEQHRNNHEKHDECTPPWCGHGGDEELLMVCFDLTE